jgi:hypothetical protein
VIEKLKQAEIRMHNGVPALFVDGHPIGPLCYQWENGYAGMDSGAMLRSMGEAGVELYFVRIYISDPAKLGTTLASLDASVALLRECVPQALVIPKVWIGPYEGFAEKYPDDVIVFDDGETGGWLNPGFMWLKDADTPRYTHASTAWKYEVGGMLRDIVAHVNASSYADRVVGYFLFALAHEWSYFWDFDASNRSYDYSPAMKHAFRNHLISKYSGSLDRLRTAWNDADVTFASALLPTRTQKQTGDFGYFWNPATSMQLYDYYECHNDVVADKLMYFASVIKAATNRRAVVGSFWGYLQHGCSIDAGQSRFKKVLDCPDLDFWASPYTYENKGPGDHASMRFVTRTLQAHGKHWFAEVDTFIYDSPPSALEGHGFPVTTPEQSENLLKREFAYPLCEGTQGWWLDWASGPSQYDSARFKPLMKRMQDIGRAAMQLPMGSVSDIAAIVDQESLLSAPPGCSQITVRAIDFSKTYELPRLGSPVDYYELNDVLNAQVRRHKLYIFLNPYSIDDDERERITKHLKCRGNVIVWMYGAGLINPDAACSCGVANASELTGIQMGITMREQRARMNVVAGASTILAGLIDGESVGDFERPLTTGSEWQENDQQPVDIMPGLINPVLYADDPDARVLGRYCDGDQAGFVMKHFDEWTSVYIGSTGVQASVLRALARRAGAHLFVEDEDIVVYANESFVTLHTERPGKRTVKLVSKTDAIDVFDGRVMGRCVDAFVDDLPQHKTTLYYTGDRATYERLL